MFMGVPPNTPKVTCSKCGSVYDDWEDYSGPAHPDHECIEALCRTRAEAEAREAVLREALQEISAELQCDEPCVPRPESFCHSCGYARGALWCAGCTARRALATPSPTALALVELERAARRVERCCIESYEYKRKTPDSDDEYDAMMRPLWSALVAALANLDRARGGR